MRLPSVVFSWFVCSFTSQETHDFGNDGDFCRYHTDINSVTNGDMKVHGYLRLHIKGICRRCLIITQFPR